jgi:hypothetical protein
MNQIDVGTSVTGLDVSRPSESNSPKHNLTDSFSQFEIDQLDDLQQKSSEILPHSEYNEQQFSDSDVDIPDEAFEDSAEITKSSYNQSETLFQSIESENSSIDMTLSYGMERTVHKEMIYDEEEHSTTDSSILSNQLEENSNIHTSNQSINSARLDSIDNIAAEKIALETELTSLEYELQKRQNYLRHLVLE